MLIDGATAAPASQMSSYLVIADPPVAAPDPIVQSSYI
jgi:hypothetical protein